MGREEGKNHYPRIHRDNFIKRNPVHDYLIIMVKRSNGAYPYKFNEVVNKFDGFEYKF
jgi:hypothetical protein